MFNRIFCIIFVLLLSASCSNQKKVFIDVELDKIKASNVVLEDINAVPFELIDSLTVSNQKFSIKSYIKNDGLYRLAFNQKDVVYLYLKKGDKIKLKITDKGFYKYTIEGNDESVQMQSLIENVATKGAEIDSLTFAVQNSVQKSNQKDSIKNILDDKKSAYINYIKEFITKQKTADVAAFAINFFGPAAQQEMPYIVQTIEDLGKKAPNSIYVKQFSDALQQYKSAMLKDEQAGLQVGNKAPNIELTNWNGDTLSLKNLNGKYVLLDFWASWCPPCRAENPNVVKLYNQYKDKGFDVYSVSLDDNVDAWKKAVQKDKLDWKNHVSELKSWESNVAKMYKIESIPTTYLLDKSGKIIAKNLRGQELENKLAELFPVKDKK